MARQPLQSPSYREEAEVIKSQIVKFGNMQEKSCDAWHYGTHFVVAELYVVVWLPHNEVMLKFFVSDIYRMASPDTRNLAKTVAIVINQWVCEFTLQLMKWIMFATCATPNNILYEALELSNSCKSMIHTIFPIFIIVSISHQVIGQLIVLLTF